MIDLIRLAERAYWTGSTINGEYFGNQQHIVDWNSSEPKYGFVNRIENAHCEDDSRHLVLHTHPKWGVQGSIAGTYPRQRMPEKAYFKTQVGFLKGAVNTDGVTFQVWIHSREGTRNIKNRVVNYHKPLTGKLEEITADLTPWSNRECKIELRVDAGNNSGRDWAIWVEPQIKTVPNLAGKVWQLSVDSLRVNKRNETRWRHGRGDEPYLGGLYFRSIFGQNGSTKVAVLDTLNTLGNNLRVGRTVPVDRRDNMSVRDIGSTTGLGIMGFQLIAMEEDGNSKGVVREILNELGDKLFEALKTHVENNPLGYLDPEKTLEEIEKEIELDDIPLRKKILEGIRTLARPDDSIGKNGVLLVSGLEDSTIERLLGDNYMPESDDNPVSGLAPQVFRITFEGDDANYTAAVSLRESSAGELVR